VGKELRVRTQIFNPENGRYLKAIDERDLSDFLALISKESVGNIVYIPDMTPIINEVNKNIASILDLKEKKELSVRHSVVYNLWNKAKVVKKESVKEKLNIEVLKESESVLNLIHTRIPDLEDSYLHPKTDHSFNYLERDVDRALDNLLAEVQVFIEIVLCHIHSSAILDPTLIEEPSVINHCQSVYSMLLKWLRKESDVTTNYKTNKVSISSFSFIYQCCIENNIELNPQALLNFLDLPQTTDDIINVLVSNATSVEREDFNGTWRKVRCLEWEEANEYQVCRAKKILRLMQQLAGVLGIFELIKDKNIEYSNSTDIFNEIKEIVRAKT